MYFGISIQISQKEATFLLEWYSVNEKSRPFVQHKVYGRSGNEIVSQPALKQINNRKRGGGGCFFTDVLWKKKKTEVMS